MPTRAQCLKFETDQAQDVKRLEKLNSLFFSYMCGKDPHADTELDGALTPTQRTVRTLTRLAVASPDVASPDGRDVASPDGPEEPTAARYLRLCDCPHNLRARQMLRGSPRLKTTARTRTHTH